MLFTSILIQSTSAAYVSICCNDQRSQTAANSVIERKAGGVHSEPELKACREGCKTQALIYAVTRSARRSLWVTHCVR